MHPLIINLAPTGLIPSRAQTPHVPLTVEEIVTDVEKCVFAGASMVHLHARDASGAATDDVNIVAAMIEGIRARCPDLVITTTTSGRRSSAIEKRATSLYLEGHCKPDMASLTLGSMNFSNEASINAPATIMRLAEIMHERGIKPELEVFDLGMINVAKILADKGLIEPPFYFNLLLGNPSTAQATLMHLATLIADLPAQSIWATAGIGRFQTQANALGVVMGHGVRVGLEDNLWFDPERTILSTNEMLINRITAQANALGRAVATPHEVREYLGLKIQK